MLIHQESHAHGDGSIGGRREDVETVVTRFPPLMGCVIFLLSLCPPSLLQAQESLIRPSADWVEVHNTIKGMRDRAQRIRTDALHTFNKAIEHCRKKIFNADCMDKAKRERITAEREATEIEKSAARIEKIVKTETKEAKKSAQAQKDLVQQAASRKPQIQAQIKREKTLIKIEKLHPSPEQTRPVNE